jgi:hypothetical protein
MRVSANCNDGIVEIFDETDINIVEMPEDLFMHLLPVMESGEEIKATIINPKNIEIIKSYNKNLVGSE